MSQLIAFDYFNMVYHSKSSILNLLHSLYTFDLRKLNQAMMVHMDHVSAVMDVDYSPTGKEFVTASYDKTIRIFPVDSGRSRWVSIDW